MSQPNTLKHKESRAKRAIRHRFYRGPRCWKSNSSPAAKLRQMRRKARNKEDKPHFEYESGEGGHLLSVTLIVPNNEM